MGNEPDDVTRQITDRLARDADERANRAMDLAIGSDTTAVSFYNGEKFMGSLSVESLTEAIQMIKQMGPPPKLRARPEAIARLEAELAPRRTTIDDPLTWHARLFAGIQIEQKDDLPYLWDLITAEEAIVCLSWGTIVKIPRQDPKEMLRDADVMFGFLSEPVDYTQVRFYSMKSRIPSSGARIYFDGLYTPKKRRRRKRPSKGMRKHIRREKARRRREVA